LQGNLLGIDYEKIPLLADTVLRGDYPAGLPPEILKHGNRTGSDTPFDKLRANGSVLECGTQATEPTARPYNHAIIRQ
ncbi:MAG: hypothetical protein K2X06_10350, partial [Burkholderiales bacterium]|nr:hypothetical protein [Burkholderiales bacterium]